MQLQGLDFDDFSGGITDNYVDAPLSQYEEADNFLITIKKKLKQRGGSVLFNTTTETVGNKHFDIITAGQRIGFLASHDNYLVPLAVSGNKIFQRNTTATAWSNLVGPASANAFPTATTANRVAAAFWNKHTIMTTDGLVDRPVKIYRESTADTTLKVRTAGLPKLTDYAASVTITPDTPGAAHTYLYAFHYFFTYTVDGTTFEDNGPVYVQQAQSNVDITDAGTNAAAQVVITAIPYISPALNWDVANIKVKVFRTIDGGATFYYLTTLTAVAGVYPTFTDDFRDDSSIVGTSTILSNQPLMYTEGGVVDNDPVPFAKYVHVNNDVAWYANVLEKVGAVYEPYAFRVRQSIPGDIDACPESFFVDVEDEITGIGSHADTPIIFCKASVYRIDGTFDELGRGGALVQKLPVPVGCLNHNSIVQTPEGVFFAGTDGFYVTDGLTVKKISENFDSTYRNITQSTAQKKAIYGAYDPEFRRVYWSLQSSVSSPDADSIYVLDLRWGVRAESSFTTWSGGTSFAPTSLMFFPFTYADGTIRDRSLVRADRRGYLLVHDDLLAADLEVDTTTTPTAWLPKRIDYEFKSAATNFGNDTVRKWVPKINVKCKGESNLSLGIESINDDGRSQKALAPIRMRRLFAWGDPDIEWGDPNQLWGYAGFIDEMRRFPHGGLRCHYKQIILKNAAVYITKSDFRGTASVSVFSGVTKSAILDDSATFDWPTNPIGMTLSFGSDSYAHELEIVSAPNPNEVRFNDPSNAVSLGAGKTWQLKGKPISEMIHLLGFTVAYAPISDSIAEYQSDSSYTGANT